MVKPKAEEQENASEKVMEESQVYQGLDPIQNWSYEVQYRN